MESWIANLGAKEENMSILKTRPFGRSCPNLSPNLYIERKHHYNDGSGFESRHCGDPRFKSNCRTDSNKFYQPNDGCLSSAHADRTLIGQLAIKSKGSIKRKIRRNAPVTFL